ncbi:MAG: M48 family metallopeptidase [Chloroflexota bacterium]|jgi:STE24 endopeptidase
MADSTIGPSKDEGREAPQNGDGDWQEKAKAFGRARIRLYAARTAALFIFLFALWYSGVSGWLDNALSDIAPQRWLHILLFLLLYQVIVALIFLPFSYYGGFVLQHRFGLSRQTASDWLIDWVKGAVIGAVFFVAGFEVFYLSIELFPGQWWWILAAGLSLMALFLTYVGPVLLLPIFYKCSPLEDQELVDRIEVLAGRAGARISRVCSINMSKRTTAANAALTGIGRTRQVLLGDTMLQQFSLDEVETVVAHELGHHVHGDIWKGLGVQVAGIWVGLFLLQWAVRPAFLGYGLGDISDLRNLPLLLLLAELAGLLLMPAFNALSRRYEAEADRFAARISNAPDAYASALYRLAKQNLAELWPPRWVEVLLYTHPAIGRRIAAVGGAGGQGDGRARGGSG